jgi:PHD/YefM family antitoxin component YafN of YafNO toxin-antitoxin module
VSPDDLDALEETLDILRDRELVASLKRSREEAAQGDSMPLPPR